MEIVTQDKVIYQLTIEDLQNVANDKLGRDLSESEIKLLEEKSEIILIGTEQFKMPLTKT